LFAGVQKEIKQPGGLNKITNVFLEKKRSCGALKVRNWSAIAKEKGVLRRRSECKVCASTQ
jgi:hypothetical protein